MGLTIAASQQALDAVFPTSAATDYIAYSENGTSETTILARTAIGATGWAAATSADPSVKANNSQVTSATATGAGTITHFTVFNASTAGTQQLDWQALDASRTLASGDQMQWAIGALQVTLT